MLTSRDFKASQGYREWFGEEDGEWVETKVDQRQNGNGTVAVRVLSLHTCGSLM